MTVMPTFQLIRATSLADVIAARRAHPGCKLLAGGTGLVTNLRQGLNATEALVDITGIRELQEISASPIEFRIGATVTLKCLTEDSRIRQTLPALADAAETVAGPTHRASATVGGNLCLDTRCVFYNQSEWWRRSNDFCLKYAGATCHVAPTGKRCHAAYSGDLAPLLLVLQTTAELAGESGTRAVPIQDLFQEDGAAHLRLQADEMLTAVRVPIRPDLAAKYEKVRYRGAIDFPLAGVAVGLRRAGDQLAELRIALTGTNSRPLLLSGCEPLVGRPLDAGALKQIDKLVQHQVSPMRTTAVPAQYRRRVAAALACRVARELFAGAGGTEKAA
jgi:4-hydroxybenzoyl-CoA reductase subunit beta